MNYLSTTFALYPLKTKILFDIVLQRFHFTLKATIQCTIVDNIKVEKNTN